MLKASNQLINYYRILISIFTYICSVLIPLTMKKTLILFAITASLSSFAQTEFNKWSLGLNLGVHDGQAPTIVHTKLNQFQHFGLNGRYMMNNRVGIQLDFGYDLFDGVNSGTRNINYFRSSLQAVVNAGDLLRFSTFSKRFGLLIHGGAGISSMWLNKDYQVGTDNTLFKKSDDMVNFIFGATPQLKVTERFSLNADLSFIFHHNQTYQFDMQNLSQHGAIDGYFLNASLGATFYFGKASSHADWTPTIYGADMTAYDKKVKELEDKLKDDDKDGIPNYNDLETATPEGSLVNSKGQAVVDSDMDGIADAYDACPTEKGPFSTNGCKDTDNDGVADAKDNCPDKAGSMVNNGCPEEKTALINAAPINGQINDVLFDYNRYDLTNEAKLLLDGVADYLAMNPNAKLKINGHTDDSGAEMKNKTLSMNRAEAVAIYLQAKGVAKSRLTIKGFGKSMPKTTNDTPEGKQMNRRVELKVN
jgi:OOP family OmpA-OmpF porin